MPRKGVPKAMFPRPRTPAAFILMGSLITALAADESASPGSIDVGDRTEDQQARTAETAGFGLEESEPANDTGQVQAPTHQPGPSESRAKPPPLGLCDGS
jgi:hypothetical protein